MKPDPVVALEIGTRKVRVLIGEEGEGGDLIVTGVGECDSRGIRKGEVVHHENALACVRHAIQLAEDQAGVIINQAYLLFSSGNVQCLVNRGTIPVMNATGEIGREEAEDVMNNARAVSLPADREVVHSIPQHFYVDDQPGVIDPKGMDGAKLSLDMLVVHGVRNRIRNTLKVAVKAGLDVPEPAFAGLCAGLAVLTPQQKERGVLVVDLGGGTTDFTIYAGKTIAHVGSLAVGGDHVTNDIAAGLKLSNAQAEKLKLESGSAMIDLSKRHQTLALASDAGFQGGVIKVVDLHTIMHARMEETLKLIRSQLESHDLIRHVGAGVVFCGGGAHMSGITRLGEQVFKLPCYIGMPQGVSGLVETARVPEHATVVGLLRYGLRAQKKRGSSKAIGNLLKNLFRK